MENQLMFNFEGESVRTVVKDNQTYFVGNEVAKILGYSNYRNAINNHAEDEDKLRTQIRYAGQLRTVTLINESGLYSLIFSSKLESAKRFKRWVTSEVLPDIRKYGMYMNDDFAKAIIDNPQEAKKEMLKYFEESERLNKLVTDLQKENDRLSSVENEVMELENKLEFLQKRPENNDWKQEANKRVRKLTPKISSIINPNFGKTWNEVYKEMLYSQNLNIKSKHTRRLKKMKSNNVPQSTIDNTKIIDTIGTDIEYVDKLFKALDNLEDKYTTPVSEEYPSCFLKLEY
ncbi:antirepressor protein [Staphylococcus phage SAP6]|uniref:Phage anti-repressor protein n=6 Tax=Silviavirus TaxID=1857889 RepID=I7CCV1_9CAUD|nr:phage anti-repressor protein [Staphylococcus phage SA11]APC42885.1 antirepressor protein [Staphylococcus phage StAP1]QYC52004.1 anti-repressor protein [Staphylococcus phage vB_Sau-RP15]UGL60674.1 antirepressor protein [Staphylococcus phage vB_SauM-HM01]WAW12132.1 antirepressor protein [Staphylococcus phage SAP6]WCO82457.1 hypothetical protein PBSA08_102 [Staphylococcus phage PBSA08]WJZ48646.1 ribosome associated inhibitor [Staphylococcus phage SAC]